MVEANGKRRDYLEHITVPLGPSRRGERRFMTRPKDALGKKRFVGFRTSSK